jgi:hypothetical protein
MTSHRHGERTVNRRDALRQGAGLVACATGLPLLVAREPGGGASQTGRPAGAAVGPAEATSPAGSIEPAASIEPADSADSVDSVGVTLPRSVAGVPIPDSRLARAAATLAHTASPAHLFQHVMRTYVFACLLFDQRGTTYDRELVFVGCALHDLGLVEDYMSPAERFEVDGADAAQRFLERWHVPRRRVELVWDAIALHGMPGIATRKAPEIAMVCLGAAMDATGLNLDQLPPTAIDSVLDAFPRSGFKQAAIETILSLCRDKPAAQMMHAFAEVGRRHLPDFTVPTVEDLILAAPFAE